MRLSEQEKQCVQLIADCFEKNEQTVDCGVITRQLGIDGETYAVLMKKMEHIGAVEKVTNSGTGSSIGVFRFRIGSFLPSARAVELTREIKAQKELPVDIVDQLKNRIRQNPWTAWPIIIILGLAFLVPAINQSWELIMKIVRAFCQGR